MNNLIDINELCLGHKMFSHWLLVYKSFLNGHNLIDLSTDYSSIITRRLSLVDYHSKKFMSTNLFNFCVLHPSFKFSCVMG